MVGSLSLHHPVPGQVDQLVQVLFGVDEPLGGDRLQDLDVDVALPEDLPLVVQEVVLGQHDWQDGQAWKEKIRHVQGS